MESKMLYGRSVITTDATEITDENVVDVLQKAFAKHQTNRFDINYLWDYYRGKQPIRNREKKVRPEINNKIVENRANEIVSFKVGYLCGEPIQYIGRSGEDHVSRGVSQLNEMMFSEDKATQDKEIVEWQMVCGTAYRLILPDNPLEEDDAPFEMHTLDPRDTFVVYFNSIGNKPAIGVKYCTDEFGQHTFSVYSDKMFWKIKDWKIVDSEVHYLQTVPIFEYPANHARLGAFEIVLPQLDALNNIASNRVDGVEQFIQAFVKFINCDIDTEMFQELKNMGGIKIKSTEGNHADVDIVSQELNQDQIQTLVDYTYQTVLDICGMPNRNGGSSGGDRGIAVELRNGWTSAETRAKDSEMMFRRAEKNVLRLVLKICRDTQVDGDVNNLRLKDIALKFTRRNYEGVQSKSQVLISMLNNEKIHPRLAFEGSGMFVDPESAYAMSMAYYEEQQAKFEEQQADFDTKEDTEEEQN